MHIYLEFEKFENSSYLDSWPKSSGQSPQHTYISRGAVHFSWPLCSDQSFMSNQDFVQEKTVSDEILRNQPSVSLKMPKNNHLFI